LAKLTAQPYAPLYYMVQKGKVKQVYHPDVYHGMAGVLLSFASFEANSNALKIVLPDLLAQLASKPYFEKLTNNDFLTGRAGVLFTLHLYQAHVPQQLLAPLEKTFFEQFEQHLPQKHDLMGGSAGVVLGCLLLYALTLKQAYLHCATMAMLPLLKALAPWYGGISLPPQVHHTYPLCGLGHGNAGVAYVATLWYALTGHKPWQALVHALNAYENAQYKIQTHNWPDYRRPFTKASQAEWLQACAANNVKWFGQYNDQVAWCHGAAGVALARHLALVAGIQGAYLAKDLQQAQQTTRQSLIHKKMGPDLCHGQAGNALALALTQCTAPEIAQVAQGLLAQAEQGQPFTSGLGAQNAATQDYSLFNGLSGITYFLQHYTQSQKQPVQTVATAFNPFHPGLWFLQQAPKATMPALLAKALHHTLHKREHLSKQWALPNQNWQVPVPAMLVAGQHLLNVHQISKLPWAALQQVHFVLSHTVVHVNKEQGYVVYLQVHNMQAQTLSPLQMALLLSFKEGATANSFISQLSLSAATPIIEKHLKAFINLSLLRPLISQA